MLRSYRIAVTYCVAILWWLADRSGRRPSPASDVCRLPLSPSDLMFVVRGCYGQRAAKSRARSQLVHTCDLTAWPHENLINNFIVCRERTKMRYCQPHTVSVSVTRASLSCTGDCVHLSTYCYRCRCLLVDRSSIDKISWAVELLYSRQLCPVSPFALSEKGDIIPHFIA